jgi:hypothetical protein
MNTQELADKMAMEAARRLRQCAFQCLSLEYDDAYKALIALEAKLQVRYSKGKYTDQQAAERKDKI